MSASEIRSRAMVTHVIDRHCWNEITDGAVLQEDATIVEIGIYHPAVSTQNVPVIGGGDLPHAFGGSGLMPRGQPKSCQSNFLRQAVLSKGIGRCWLARPGNRVRAAAIESSR
jgi:hypothetical protein